MYNMHLDPVPPQRRRTGGIKPTQQSATKMLLIWLESYEDHLTVPLGNLNLLSKLLMIVKYSET